MIDFWKGLGELLRRGETVWLAMVADSSRHSPGTAGAGLWVTVDSGSQTRSHGTIGGGALEHRLIENVRRAAVSDFDTLPDFEARTYHQRRQVQVGAGPEGVPSETSGLICAGWQTHVHLLCRPDRDSAAVEEWIGLGTKIINELRLDLSREQDDAVYDYGMRRYLGLTDEHYEALTGSAPAEASGEYIEVIDTILARSGQLEDFGGELHKQV